VPHSAAGTAPARGSPGRGRGPAAKVPSRAWTRCRMPAMPRPDRRICRSEADSTPLPLPSSSTCTTSSSGAYPRRTVARASPPAWRTTLVSASCTMRNAARPTPAGTGLATPSTASWTSRPATRVRRTRPSRSRGPAVGARGAQAPDSPCASSPSPRLSTSITERSSASASSLASLMASRAGRACWGRSSSRCSATPDCTLMSEMLWASTSCSSRAMSSRSSLARRRASSRATCDPLGAPLQAATRDLGGGADQWQPDEVRGGVGEAAGPLHLVGDQGRQPGEGRVGDHQHAPGERAPAHHDGAHQGEREGGEAGRPAGVTAGGIAGGGREGDRQGGFGPAPAEQQRHRAGDQQHVCERVERPTAGLVLAVTDRAGDLDEGDHQGEQHVQGPGPQPPAGANQPRHHLAWGLAGRACMGTRSPRPGCVVSVRSVVVTRAR
jgi:hypothetical protein